MPGFIQVFHYVRLIMKFNLIILAYCVVILLSDCSKATVTGAKDLDQEDSTIYAQPRSQTSYTITESFETANKGAYASADVNLNTGSWNFDDALLGEQAADLKAGNKSVRLRNGSISMNFNVSGLRMIYIKHGKYGSDGNSTWQLLISTDNGLSYKQLGDDIIDTNTSLVTDSFAVSTTGKVRFKIAKSGSTRINIDDIAFKGTGDPGINVNQPVIPDTDPSTPETARDVIAGTDAQPATGDDSNLLFGNPSSAQSSTASAENYLIDQKYYVQSYSRSRGIPNWVSWHIDATTITGAAKRQDNFAGWISIPSSWYQVQSNSYSDSGFDRGHNCPSGDRTSSVNANSSTFLMTNMIPQAPQNNQETWNNFESYLRTQVTAGNEVYIVMGNYGAGGVGTKGEATTIDNGRITVPAYIWKVALIIPAGDNDVKRVSASTRVIAINTPNRNDVDSDWKKYLVSVDEIEQVTGYNLFSILPATVQNVLEASKYRGN